MREMVVQVGLYWTTVGGAYMVRTLIHLQEREEQAARLALEKSQLEATLRQAELETLRARLNPHFLFNCLQNISVLTREDPKAANQMLSRLGTLLRSALRRDGTPETTLADEVELTQAYLSVEKVRFADRLAVLFDVAGQTQTALVPSLLPQPLVENAILHGLRGVDHKGLVSIQSEAEGDRLIIAVTDNGTGLPVKNPSEMELGVGLASTCERLEKMYPNQHSFSIAALPEGGTQVASCFHSAFPPLRAQACSPMNKLRLLLVDDEHLIRKGLRHALFGVADIEVVGECGTGSEAIQAISISSPDLVLLDVQMPDCTGLDVVREIGARNMPVIFITAYDDYAVSAFELNAVDYLLKPFEEARIRESIERARIRISQNSQSVLSQKLEKLLDNQRRKWPDRLVVHSGERYEFVPVESIDWIEAANNYVVLHCGSKQHLLGETMTSLEGRLDPARFVRIHRGRIVNIKKLVGLHPLFSGTYALELQGGVRITTGRQYKDTVQNLLNT